MAYRPLDDLMEFSTTMSSTSMTCRQPARTEAICTAFTNIGLAPHANLASGTAMAHLPRTLKSCIQTLRNCNCLSMRQPHARCSLSRCPEVDMRRAAKTPAASLGWNSSCLLKRNGARLRVAGRSVLRTWHSRHCERGNLSPIIGIRVSTWKSLLRARNSH